MTTELKGIEITISYSEGEFQTEKKVSMYFSSIKVDDTASRIRGAIEAIVKELPKAMKHDYHVTIDMNAMGSDYKHVDGYRYITDNYDRKLQYRKWVPSANIMDIDQEVVYEKNHKNGYKVFDTAKMCKALQQDMTEKAHSLVWNYGRVNYDLSF